MLCPWVRDDLTALADAELPSWRAAVVRRHLSRCEACSRESAAIAASVALQRRLLPALGPAEVEADALWGRVRGRLDGPPAAEAAARERRWVPSTRLVFAAAAACVVVAVLLGRAIDPWLVVVGLEDPPKLVAEKPELFVDYPLFENLDAIEQLDRIERKGTASGRRGRG